MVRHTCPAILLALLFVGCKDLGPVSDSNTTSELPKTGQLLVDVFSIACTAKVNPQNDSLQAYFPLSLQYHFQGSPGSLNFLEVVFDNHLRVRMYFDGPFPDSIGGPETLSRGFWTTNNLAQMDSVVVQCRLSGVYCGRVDGNPEAIGTFEWIDQRKIRVVH